MKISILILTVLLTSSVFAVEDDPVSSAAYFVDGFLRGSLDREIGRVDDCLVDGDKIIADVDKIISDISKGGFDLLTIIMDIGSILYDVPNCIKQCKDLPDTVKDVYSGWLKKIQNPLVIGRIVVTALTRYRTQLEGDANDFVSLWKSKQYEASGQKLGDIPHVLFDLCLDEDKDITVTLQSLVKNILENQQELVQESG